MRSQITKKISAS